MRMLGFWAAVVCWALLSGSQIAVAGDFLINLAATKDATLYESVDGSIANGSGQFFFVGSNDGGIGGQAQRRAVIAFNTTAIPSGSTITGATLHLWVSRAQPVASTVGLYRLTRDWNEGPSAPGGVEGSGAVATTGDVTWIHTNRASQFWSNPAAVGNFLSASATKAIPATLVMADPPAGFQVTWSSPSMIADVQAWLDTPNSNFGWLLIGTNASMSVKRFDSRENFATPLNPTLTVTYAPEPAPGASALAALAAVCCLAAQNRTPRGRNRPRGA